MVSHGIELAIIESDAKIFVDALINPSLAIPWRILVLTQDTIRLNSLGLEENDTKPS